MVLGGGGFIRALSIIKTNRPEKRMCRITSKVTVKVFNFSGIYDISVIQVFVRTCLTKQVCRVNVATALSF